MERLGPQKASPSEGSLSSHSMNSSENGSHHLSSSKENAHDLHESATNHHVQPQHKVTCESWARECALLMASQLSHLIEVPHIEDLDLDTMYQNVLFHLQPEVELKKLKRKPYTAPSCKFKFETVGIIVRLLSKI